MNMAQSSAAELGESILVTTSIHRLLSSQALSRIFSEHSRSLAAAAIGPATDSGAARPRV
jgi:hypothetical protein